MKKTKNCGSGWWVVLLTATLAVGALADAGVGLFNARLKQVITSSTLKWANLKKEAMEYYVAGAESQQGPIYVCRTRHEGDMLLGQLRPDYTSCAVSGSKSYNVFEVLENIENASLIMWKSWNKFNSKPSGAVVGDSSGDSVFIGRMKAESGFSHNIGRIIYESTVGFLFTFDEKNKELEENSGEILVEIEPLSYKLENVELDLETQHERQTDPQVYEERILRNDGDAGATVTTEIEYKYNYTLSWGHGHGIAIGLNTTIEMSDGTLLQQIEWANPFSEERKELYKLEKYLEPGTACNVTFRGNNTDRDVLYTAKLVTFYKDNNARSRQMRGERIENTVEVEAIYGEIYYTVNNTLVPTTTTTTTTTTSTTTTTTQAPAPLPPSVEKNDVGMIMDSNDILGDSGEDMVKAPPVKEDINRSVVGGLGSNPNGASSDRIIVLTLFVSLFALLL
ncbi:protein unzipped [Vanessa tameamea]|uniref:Protein unzipped n=2 Tax=Vanessa TaxID=42274 RepID=A0A8B8HXD8_VANTA|nr:protein unzipped [Vanessa tameamea]XP_047544923.1 protein unzipped isoform X1 [Vanessa atalanta]